MMGTARVVGRRAAGAVVAAGVTWLVGCAADLNNPSAMSVADRLDEANRLVALGVSAQESNDLDTALVYYKRSLELNPNAVVPWHNLGLVLMEQGHYLDAAAALKRAAEVNPDPHDARPFASLGLLYYKAGFAEQSLEYYTMSLERDPNWLPSLRGTALSAAKLNKSDQRLADVMRRGLMIETDPKWRDVFERQRLRVEGQLREKEKARVGM